MNATTAAEQIRAALQRELKVQGRLYDRWQHGLAEVVAEVTPLLADNLPRAAAGDEVAVANLGYIADLVTLRGGRINADLLAAERLRLGDVAAEVIKGILAGAARGLGNPLAGAVAGAATAAIGLAAGPGQAEHEGADAATGADASLPQETADVGGSPTEWPAPGGDPVATDA